MSKSAERLIYTDTRQLIYWGAGFGIICFILALYSFSKGLEVGIGSVLAVVAGWGFLTSLRHLESGKKTVLELREDDIIFSNGIKVRYADIVQVWAADPFPMLGVGTLNLVLHLKPDAQITQTGRSIRALFFQSWVGANISLIRKKKMVSLMCPGLKPLGHGMDVDAMIDEIIKRAELADS
ncbi:hypothetical protein IFT48_00745 [Pseudomonas fluorescens]|uniref:hypothetical protein n=1 Tax=Pseudomonas fluorescens TaxID=294 RepID=UPI0017831BC0|nr:hypothetical protein [Pseudomonas fluorescens]MBD8088519.1 hypothetical protein [Pseudomonas fluorescens]MBD8615022.1 hypothetical protein [Pseudomonas putida]